MARRDIRLAIPVAPQRFESFDGWLRRLAAAHDATVCQIFAHVGADPLLANRDLACGVKTNGGYDHEATVALATLLAESVSLPLASIMDCISPAAPVDLLPAGRRIYACPFCWKSQYEVDAPLYFCLDWSLKISWGCLIHKMPLIDTTLHNLFEPYGIGRNLDVAIEHSQQIAARYCRLTPSRNFLYDAYNLVFHGEKAYHPLDVKKYVNALRNNKFHLSNNRIALLASYANVDAMGRQARFADRPPTIGTQFSQLFFGPKPVPPSPEFFEAPRIDELLMCLFDVIRRPLLFQVVKARGIFYRLDRYDFRRRGARVTELGERLEKAIWPILYMNDRVQDGPSRIDVLNALGQSIAYLETIEIDDKSSDQTLLPTTTLRMMLASLHADSDLPAFNLGCTALTRALNARLVAYTKHQNRGSIRSSAFFRDVPPADADTSFEAWASAHDPKSRYRRWRW